MGRFIVGTLSAGIPLYFLGHLTGLTLLVCALVGGAIAAVFTSVITR